MDFEITNNEDESIQIKVEFVVTAWDDVEKIMVMLDEEVGNL